MANLLNWIAKGGRSHVVQQDLITPQEGGMFWSQWSARDMTTTIVFSAELE